ncbi:MAG: hypothetical protein CM15mP32_1490 [Flavobacteriaceae bacterium]|nr:MAG: hypothetical protein CM15mP32_1490 [Flavobacteriaceae bacterium]
MLLKEACDKISRRRAKLKAFVFFKGRSIVFKEQGHILLLRLAQDLENYGKVEQLPKLEGKKMIMLMNPKNNKYGNHAEAKNKIECKKAFQVDRNGKIKRKHAFKSHILTKNVKREN